jgi:hypothetical protein
VKAAADLVTTASSLVISTVMVSPISPGGVTHCHTPPVESLVISSALVETFKLLLPKQQPHST